MRARDKTFTLLERELNEWGYQLLQGGKPKQAIEIFRLATRLYPESANAYDSLADAYDQSGNKAEAIENYRRSIALNPANKNAEQRLAIISAKRQPSATPDPG